jgi:CHAD domain-containing protein
MADGKWIRGLTPDLPLDEAARRVLLLRLEVVREFLPLARTQAERDPEYVHQLRVGTRRADAALRIFRCCLPGKLYRAARERLRVIRKAAGAARDWDVFRESLRERLDTAGKAERAGLDVLVGYALGQRDAAQAALAALEQDVNEPFADFVTATVDAVHNAERGHTDLIDLARTLMPALLGRLDQAAAGDLGDYVRLHQVRIAGKRLRYAMEVFVVCFAPAFRESVYPQIEEMQETLGLANDSHVASERLARLAEGLGGCATTWARARAGVEALRHFHEERLQQQRQAFLTWWEAWKERTPHEILPGLVGASLS